MFNYKNEHAYQHLAESIDRSSEDLDLSDNGAAKRTLLWGRTSIFYCTILFFISNLISSKIGAVLAVRSLDYDHKCALHTTAYSPIVKEVEIKYRSKYFNGTFMTEDVYRRPGDPDVDAAWEALGVDYKPGAIAFEEGLKSGLTPAHIQRSDQYGGGFLVNVEGLHHLHCLNLIRKSLYYNYQHYTDLGKGGFGDGEDFLELHISHCVDTLRQVLMCNVDTGLMGYVWYDPAEPKAFPDFNTRHTCKNYDDVRRWAELIQPAANIPPDYIGKPRPGDAIFGTP